MSLIIFLNTVKSKIDYNDYQLIEYIYDLLNKNGKKFKDKQINSYFQSLEISMDKNKLIFNEMLNSKLIEKKIEYVCDESEESGLLIGTNKCEYCNQSIYDSNHETEVIYNIKKDFSNLIHLLQYNIDKDTYLDSEYSFNLEKLIENKDYLIPFYGAGLSMPLGYPSWGKLLSKMIIHIPSEFQARYKSYIEDGDLLKALNYLKDSSQLNTEEVIKEEIVNTLINMSSNTSPDKDNNYLDLYDLKADFYMTTNYDNVFTELATRIHRLAVPLIGKDIKNLQKLNREKKQRVIHLHGNIDLPETMIVTEDDYTNLYKDEEFKINLQSIMSNKSFLFLGFSFSDEFFNNIYTDIINKIKGNHFLIAPNISRKDSKFLAEKNIRVIGVNVKLDKDGNYIEADYIKAIRVILSHLSNS